MDQQRGRKKIKRADGEEEQDPGPYPEEGKILKSRRPEVANLSNAGKNSHREG